MPLNAIASLFSAGIGNLIGSSNTRKTNEANMKIAEMNNATQIQLMREQNRHNLNLWHLNNEYNSPYAQVRRYKTAGINPYLAMSGGQLGSGNSSSPASAASTPSLSTPTMQNFIPQMPQFNLPTLLDLANVNKVNSETEGQDLNNQITKGSLPYLIAAAKFNSNLLEANAKNAKDSNEGVHWDNLLKKYSWQNLFYDSMVKKETYRNEINSLNTQYQVGQDLLRQSYTMNEAQLQSIHLDSALKRVNLEWLPRQLKEQVNNAIAQARVLASQEGLNYAQAKYTMSLRANEILKGHGIELENTKLDMMLDDLVNEQKYKTSLSYWQSQAAKYGSVVEKWNAFDAYHGRDARERQNRQLLRDPRSLSNLYHGGILGLMDVTGVLPSLIKLGR